MPPVAGVSDFFRGLVGLREGRLRGMNPFARLSAENARTINIHIGSMEWWTALKRDGAKVDVEAFIKLWQERNAIYQQQSRKYWLYN